MMSLEEILKDLRKYYNKNPLNWRISVNKDSLNHGNILISNPDFELLWQIKLDSLYKPNPIGIGAKIKDFDFGNKNIDLKMPSFGYRPLLDEQLEQLQFKILEKKPLDNLIMDILNNDPIPVKDAKNKGLLEGPITFSPPGYISKRQKELDKKLKRDLNQLKYRQGLGLQYI